LRFDSLQTQNELAADHDRPVQCVSCQFDCHFHHCL
jgi:hypothetical protein